MANYGPGKDGKPINACTTCDGDLTFG